MSGLIDADAFVEAIKGVEVSWYLDGNYTTYDETTIMDIIKQQPPVEAVPKSYAEQIRWERDVAVGQLNEIGCQFGQKMDEVKDKLNSAKNWIPCSERLPEKRDWYLAMFKEPDTGFIGLPYIADYLMGNHTAYTTKDGWIIKDCTDRNDCESLYHKNLECVAWMPLPEPYKGETENDES